MEPIKTAALAVLGLASRDSERSWEPNAPVVRDDASNLPEAFVPLTDLEIPNRVWSAWAPSFGDREIVRALRDDERAALQARTNELRPALEPFIRTHDEDRVAEALCHMFGSFPSMRQQGADAVGRIDGAMRALSEFPAWAIEEGCRSIQRNGYECERHGLMCVERHWPPSDPEICRSVAKVVQMRRSALATAEGLLKARVEQPPPPKLSIQEIEAKLGRRLSAPKDRMPTGYEGDEPRKSNDGGHTRRVMEDLERRRAQRATEDADQAASPANSQDRNAAGATGPDKSCGISSEVSAPTARSRA
jgi:hypothetical protein